MSLIKFETDFILTWSLLCVITNSTDKKTFAITYTELSVSQDNAKLFQQSKCGSEKTIDWNKYLAKKTNRKTKHIFRLLNLTFQWVNRFFVIPFENDVVIIVHTGYFLPNVEMKGFNVMINWQNFFHLPLQMI